MIRILIFIFLGYVAYRALRKYLAPGPKPEPPAPAGVGSVDEMVQDPLCKTYVPRRTAYRRTVNGREYFFCSEACADRFEEQTKGS
ncbi:MAG: YHS domain-containing protein [Deltaproteobacteria bacterium]|nr:YHS domain-containing protein [Deltaproteobacteria bacterium]